MRFSISGHDKDTGQAIELIVEAVDVPSAAAVADRKGVRVTGVQPADGVTPPPMPVHGPRVAGLAPPSAMPRQTTPPKPKMRLWLGLFLVVSWLFAPVFPGYALGVGSTLALLVLLYLSVGPMRRGLGGFLRVSSDKPAWRAIKLTTFAIVSVSLIGFAAAGYAAQRASAELAVRKAVVDAARAQEEADANTQVSKLIDDAKAALTAGDITKAEQSINDALKVNLARNQGLASSLQAAIKNAGDPAWALDTLARLSDADFEMFNSGSKTLASLDLGYSVLTDRAVANARTQVDAVVAKRAEIKKQEEDAAEARRQQAAAAAESARQKAAAEAEERVKVMEAKAAAEAAERAKFEKAQGETLHIGYTSYCAWNSHWSERLSSNQFLNKRANANWLFVDMTIRNNDKKARMVPPLKLVDEQGREYESSAQGMMIENSIGVLETLNPDVSKQGYVVFDVPTGRKYKLKLSGGYWSGGTGYIRLEPTDK